MRYRSSYYVNVITAIVFALVTMVTVTPFILPHQLIYNSLPECENKHIYKRECTACGLTRSFCEISKGNFPCAEKYNKASIPLFGIFLTYQLLFAFFIIKHNYKRFFNLLKT